MSQATPRTARPQGDLQELSGRPVLTHVDVMVLPLLAGEDARRIACAS